MQICVHLDSLVCEVNPIIPPTPQLPLSIRVSYTQPNFRLTGFTWCFKYLNTVIAYTADIKRDSTPVCPPEYLPTSLPPSGYKTQVCLGAPNRFLAAVPVIVVARCLCAFNNKQAQIYFYTSNTRSMERVQVPLLLTPPGWEKCLKILL